MTTDPSSDGVERLRANIHRSPFGWTWKPNAMPSAADVADVLATIERLSAELERCREALRGKAIAAECKRDLSNTANTRA